MKIKSIDELKNAVNLLEEVMDIINDNIILENEELHTDSDYYDRLNDILNNLETEVASEERFIQEDKC